jgi:hypothetical protein
MRGEHEGSRPMYARRVCWRSYGHWVARLSPKQLFRALIGPSVVGNCRVDALFVAGRVASYNVSSVVFPRNRRASRLTWSRTCLEETPRLPRVLTGLWRYDSPARNVTWRLRRRVFLEVDVRE